MGRKTMQFDRPMVVREIVCEIIIQQIDGLVQDFTNSSALTMELLQSYIKTSIYQVPIQNTVISAFRSEIHAWNKININIHLYIKKALNEYL